MKYSPRWRIGIVLLTIFTFAGLVVAGFLWLAIALAVTIVLFGIPQSYDLQPTELVLRSGIVRRRIAYEKIVKVEEVLSPQRPEGEDAAICIRTESGRVVRLSPRDPGGFLRDLMARLPHLAKAAEEEAN